MRITLLPALLFICAFTVANECPQVNKNEPPQRYTVTVYYCACTDGGDFSVDSGTVIMPPQFRQEFVEARYQQNKRYGTTRKKVAQALRRDGYQVSSLRSTTPAAWDSLFTPPGCYSCHNQDGIETDEDRKAQAGYWRRRYRITGTIVGLNKTYPVFKVQKAVRIADVASEEK